MKLNELAPNEGSNKKRTRVGRGIGSGKGKTCGRGVKGQKARTGVAINGFEGGQMPLYRRLPKSGFNNPGAKEYAVVSLAQIQRAVDAGRLDSKSAVDEPSLIAAGLARKAPDGIRVLANGEIKTKISLKVAGATAGAKQAIEKVGGTVEIVKKEVKPVTPKDSTKKVAKKK